MRLSDNSMYTYEIVPITPYNFKNWLLGPVHGLRSGTANEERNHTPVLNRKKHTHARRRALKENNKARKIITLDDA